MRQNWWSFVVSDWIYIPTVINADQAPVITQSVQICAIDTYSNLYTWLKSTHSGSWSNVLALGTAPLKITYSEALYMKAASCAVTYFFLAKFSRLAKIVLILEHFFNKKILLEVKSLKRLFLRKSRHISLLGSWHVALKMWRMLKRFFTSYPVHSEI